MKIEIQNVRMVDDAPIGVRCVPYKYLSQGTDIDGHPCAIAFDKDPRFLNVKYGNKDDQYELVPIANVLSIQIKMVD